jgi:hypothetical protein
MGGFFIGADHRLSKSDQVKKFQVGRFVDACIPL